MQYIRRSEDRGKVNIGWLRSNHSFSFGHYYDPKHMGFSVLRVINDDRVKPGEGFPTHGHRDMEIISYVIDGALAHSDSSGNEMVLKEGEVQRMSAGSGITHSEYNASETDEVNFLQIWIEPKLRGIAPSYEQKFIEQDSSFTPLVTPDGRNDSLVINQDAALFRLRLKEGESFDLKSKIDFGYLHLVKGTVETDSDSFKPGDAFSIDKDAEKLTVTAQSDIEALVFQLPELN